MKKNPQFPCAAQNAATSQRDFRHPPPAHKYVSPVGALCVPAVPCLDFPQNTSGSSSSSYCDSFSSCVVPSDFVSGSLPSQSAYSVPTSYSGISNSCSIHSNTTMSVFRISSRTPYCKESLKQNEIPHNNNLEQDDSSPLELGAPMLSTYTGSNPAHLYGSLMLIEQDSSTLWSADSVSEYSMAVQQSDPVLHQNSPALQEYNAYPSPNIADVSPGQGTFPSWHNPSAKQANSIQSSQDEISLYSPRQEYNSYHYGSPVDHPVKMSVRPYPSPQTPRHTSTLSKESKSRHSSTDSRKHWFQNEQPEPSPLMLTKQGSSSLWSAESVFEDSMAVQESNPVLQKKSSTLQAYGEYPSPNITLTVDTDVFPDQSAFPSWHNPSVKQANSIQSSQDEIPLYSPHQEYNSRHYGASNVDHPVKMSIRPYPSPQIPRHTSTHSKESKSRHSSTDSRKHWFQNEQPLPSPLMLTKQGSSLRSAESVSEDSMAVQQSDPVLQKSSTLQAYGEYPTPNISLTVDTDASPGQSRFPSSYGPSTRQANSSLQSSQDELSETSLCNPNKKPNTPHCVTSSEFAPPYPPLQIPRHTFTPSEPQQSFASSNTHRNGTQKIKSKSYTEDGNGRANSCPRSWSYSSVSRSSGSRPHRVVDDQNGCSKRDTPSVLQHSRCHTSRFDEARKNYNGESEAEVQDNAEPCTILKESSRENSLTLEDKEFKKDEEKHHHKMKSKSCSEDIKPQQCDRQTAELEFKKILEHEKSIWTRSSPSDFFYEFANVGKNVMRGTMALKSQIEKFRCKVLERAERVRAGRPHYEPPQRKKMKLPKASMKTDSSSSSDESSANENDIKEELKRKRAHPYHLHPETWYNDPGELNFGPYCGCSPKARRFGIHHGFYPGETHLEKCNPETNNADRLFHYRILISPVTNFLTMMPTVIHHDDHEFIFEGFSMFSHAPLAELPNCKFNRFGCEYTILYIAEKFPPNFTVQELDLFFDYIFYEILELVDLNFKAPGDKDGCPVFHFMPRFVRELPENGREILSMNEVIRYLLLNSSLLISEKELPKVLKMSDSKWQKFSDQFRGMIVTNPGMKPCSLRVDRLDKSEPEEGKANDLEIVHFSVQLPKEKFLGTGYSKIAKEYTKLRDVVTNLENPSGKDKNKLKLKKTELKNLGNEAKLKRNVTVVVSAKGFHRTGINSDIVQHALVIPVLVSHLRFHRSCDVLEKEIGYKFKDRYLLQLALTHSSYSENYGTNPDHVKNSLLNCGIREPEFGDLQMLHMKTKKRGINSMINTMSRFGKKTETESLITNYERLEFLGDAVLDFICSLHLFLLFPHLREGCLTMYKIALVQNAHFAYLSEFINLGGYILRSHGADICHDRELNFIRADCFEALFGALYLDGGIKAADRVFGEIFLKHDQHILSVWNECPPHPLQSQEPKGDRKWIEANAFLQKLTKFEESIGVEFKHIRLLAKAFTDVSAGFTYLTLGSNQRLEFLGDAVLQLIVTDYLYKHFPDHYEGHLTYLRSSLVNNATVAAVCDDLGIVEYAVYDSNNKTQLKTKDRADLLEALLGALYLDQGMEYCQVLCSVCLFPRLEQIIIDGEWIDPKSKLQQCCLTLHTVDGNTPDVPIYKVVEAIGSSDLRVYTVAVYFRGYRLALGKGHSIREAEINAARKALDLSHDLIPKLDFRNKVKPSL